MVEVRLNCLYCSKIIMLIIRRARANLLFLSSPLLALQPLLNYTSWAAVAIEQEGYIDAINTPEWGVDQICERFNRCRV